MDIKSFLYEYCSKSRIEPKLDVRQTGKSLNIAFGPIHPAGINDIFQL